MRTIKRVLSVPTIIALFAICAFGIAFADSGAASTGSVVVPMPSPVAQIAALALSLIAMLIRKGAPDSHFFHTRSGAIWLAVGVSVITTASEFLKSSGFAWAGLTAAILGAGQSLLATYNPSISSTNQSKIPDPPSMSAPTKGGAMSDKIPFMILGLLLGGLVSCATPGGVTLGHCELGQIPQASQLALTDLTGIIAVGASDWEQQVEAAAAKLVPGQASCIIKAIVAAWTGKAAELSPQMAVAVERGQAYLKKHPAKACGEYNEYKRLRACVPMQLPMLHARVHLFPWRF